MNRKCDKQKKNNNFETFYSYKISTHIITLYCSIMEKYFHRKQSVTVSI